MENNLEFRSSIFKSKTHTQIIIGLSIFLITMIYFLMHGRYILHHVDDAWFGSRIYHFFTTGFNIDTVFDAPEVVDKTQIFYVFFNSLYGSILDFFGWSKSNAHLICTFFMALSAPVWYFIFRKMKFSFEVALLMGLSLMLFPVYFKAANHVRPDSMAFFLGSLSLLLFLSRYYLFSGLMLMIAFESHLMTCTFGVYMVTYVGCNWDEYFGDRKKFFQNVGWFVFGILLGLLYYYWLNRDVLTIDRVTSLLMGHRNMGEQEFFKHIFTTYFVQKRWYLHIWEFFMIAISLYLYFKHKLHKKLPFIGILIGVLFLSTIILSRPNKNYMIYFFPAFQMLIFYTFEQIGKLKTFAQILILLFILQYSFRYFQYHDFDLREVMAQTEMSIPDKTIPVVGIPDNWFPAREHKFYPIYRSVEGFPKEELDTFYLIRNDYKFQDLISAFLESWLADIGLIKDTVVEKRKRFYEDHFQYFESNCDCEEINRFHGFEEDDVVIYRCVKKQGQRRNKLI
ncbi:MAG: hypothetical protein NXI23_07785 [Bacteroidetes bacterium]|jgi:hypothetical protein|nr:hypothetical protein [Bacteroidota bacterium]MDF1866504.1 hypothetical protein [Saprospiraceae bacterium]